tara:strand:- start:815 stop:967 length:153 start_codon:yes stop_codon:yes gene_type:complete
MAKKAAKKETKKEVKEAPKEKQVTKVWNGVSWVTVDEDSPEYNPGKQPQG